MATIIKNVSDSVQILSDVPYIELNPDQEYDINAHIDFVKDIILITHRDDRFQVLNSLGDVLIDSVVLSMISGRLPLEADAFTLQEGLSKTPNCFIT